MHALQIWTTAARPRTLGATLSPVILGTTLALSDGFFNIFLFCMTLLTGLGIQITTNLANDYFDFIKGADKETRKGPKRVMQAGLVSLPAMRKAIAICMIATLCSGLYLVFQGGLIISLLLALSLILALAYTGGPYPLAYLGLGDLFVFVFYGPIAVLGTYFLQKGHFSWDPVLIGIGLGAISTEILSVNNLRDVEEDALANKKTLIVRLGKKFGKIKYAISLTIAAILPLLFVSSHPLVLLSLLFIFPALGCIKTVFTYRDPRELNETLAKTGQLTLIYSLLFSIGWLYV